MREGDEAYYGPNEDLLHKNCNDANRREIERWNEDVRKDREARG